ncbi:hypothetical protein [Thiococcus pfennigii]|uniref:hypothetical protein n=1 Tax=Thiococcus pfennigii TaxID=1057 RepID=UPI001904FE1D|nr:hypothetical protein [Thiococcus pfennigii]
MAFSVSFSRCGLFERPEIRAAGALLVPLCEGRVRQRPLSAGPKTPMPCQTLRRHSPDASLGSGKKKSTGARERQENPKGAKKG